MQNDWQPDGTGQQIQTGKRGTDSGDLWQMRKSLVGMRHGEA